MTVVEELNFAIKWGKTVEERMRREEREVHGLFLYLHTFIMENNFKKKGGFYWV